MARRTFFIFIALLHIFSISAQAEGFKVTSKSIAEGKNLDPAHIYQGFGCNGGNIAPDLSWSKAPEGTKSFAVTMYDPDAPTGSGWWHWFVFNIPSDVYHLAANTRLPENAVELKNDYGIKGFGGACPPPGEVHRYQFTVHALDTILDLDHTVSNALAGYMVRAHSIGSDTITAIYKR